MVEQVPEPQLQVNHLKMHFALQRGFSRRSVGTVKAVDDVSFDLHGGETKGVSVSKHMISFVFLCR